MPGDDAAPNVDDPIADAPAVDDAEGAALEPPVADARGPEASDAEPTAPEPAAETKRAAPEPREPFVARARAGVISAYQAVRDHYGKADPRTVGIFRIALGLLLTGDTLRHWYEASWAYSNSGVLTNHYHLFRPDGGYNFSIFHAFSSIEEVDVAFGAALLCHLCLLVGWHARLFAFASFVVVTSMDNRLIMVENGGYVVVNLIVAYSMFLPLGRRFSVEALARSYRERKERSVGDLAQRYRPASLTEPYVSIASALVVLNLAAVYFFNVVNKSGNLWRTGETVHYVLWLNRMVTGLAVIARQILPFWATRLVTWSVLCTEALLVAWILSPFAKRVTRPLAIVFLTCLHTSFGLMMRLGPFSWYLVGWGTLLLAPEQWEDLETWQRAHVAPRVVVLERGSALALAVGRLLARLDAYDRLSFEESDPEGAAPPLVRVRLGDGEAVGFAAARAVAEALPLGRFAFPVLRVASLGALDLALRFVFDATPARRAAITRFFGLDRAGGPRERAPSTSPLARRGRFATALVREAMLAWLFVCSVVQVLIDNKSVPPWLKPKDVPSIVHATLGYPRMFQGWGMFAPNPITDDGSVTVDAITIAGRHVDPFTGKPPELDLTKSDGLGLSQIRQDYFNRIRLDRNKHFRQGLHDWILKYPKRTGDPEDEIVAFDVYWVRDMCPRPHETKPYDNKLIALLTYRKPGYRPRRGLPPLPPEPPVESAEGDKPKPDAAKGAPSATPAASGQPKASAKPSVKPAKPPAR